MAEAPTDPTQDFSGGAAFVDGRFVPVGEARVPILDWGFLHSDATYDVAHVWDGRFFRLNDHLARFERGMARLRMELGQTRQDLRGILMECVRLSGLRNAFVEMICTRGVPPSGSRDPRQCRNTLFAFAVPFVWIAAPGQQETGLALRISEVQRIPPKAVDPTVKNYHWLDLTAGLFDAYRHGDETAVLTDGSGNVVEGPGFNVFKVRHGIVATPAAGMLEGITRRTVIELGRAAGMTVEERAVSASELRDADEVFITSTAGGVMPIARLDGAPIGQGRPGPMTQALRERYWQAHREPAWSEPVAYSDRQVD
jgi:branched-chain amino acid aminotransferase